MTTQDERMHILEMLEQGKLSAAEATQLIDALLEDDLLESGEVDESDNTEFGTADPVLEDTLDFEYSEFNPPPEPPEIPPEMRKWRGYWLGLFVVSMGALLLSTFLMYQALQSSGYGFWFFCSWVPFMLSVFFVALAWQSRSMPWLHLRVDTGQNEWPRRIAFSFPLPLGLASWGIRTFGHWIPNLEQSGFSSQDLGKIIYGLQDYTSPDNPVYIEVDEDDGERVLIYIG